MPCYNEPAKVFRRSLESVIHQTLKEIEIIIILDNPENTELENIIWEYQRKYKNILLLSPEINLWRWNARNLWITFAEGKYIAIHDADDIDLPERLEEQYNYMETHPDIGVVFSDVVYVNTLNYEINSSPIIKRWEELHSFFRKPLNHPTMFLRKKVLESENIRYTSMNHSEDFEFWMQLFWKGIGFWYMDKVHARYLSPNMSEHTDFIEKMKSWKISTLQALWKHKKTFRNDIYFYLRIWVAISDYIALMFWKKWYNIHRKFLNMITRMITL